jgi:hypothetical protein
VQPLNDSAKIPQPGDGTPAEISQPGESQSSSLLLLSYSVVELSVSLLLLSHSVVDVTVSLSLSGTAVT